MITSFSKTAEKQYAKLPKSEQNKIDRKAELLQHKPLSGKKLEGVLREKRSLKGWPYRIIYIIDTKKKVLYILSILNRQGAY
ncbi:type II toxin-antitoxin system RelE/ParE family toxin [Patescibacteria group bacterium]|nr:type II toxin-antitoxin system RelE/ParE family toxin [Patescibacteria group bacterium]MBU1472346.1 type II toxin-antitoxin system RelE/ParE family toxin [Patescibacteria group bacterium]MBU2460402.1 type II toxin-antitoxin system RelE/ParE family toxin [Patescibacteria group bacterium]MBU2544217.1 type II toxin-antitoxin system RelE/ParE family toxin [Patescibacteria group bacterium]